MYLLYFPMELMSILKFVYGTTKCWMRISRSTEIQIRDWCYFAISHLAIISFYYMLLLIPIISISPLCFFIAITLHLAYFVRQHRFYANEYPPGPPPMAIFGNGVSVNTRAPEKTFLEYRAIYGPVFTLHLSQPTVILADYNTIHEALIHNGQKTSGRSNSESFVLFTGDRTHGDGVILSSGQKSKNMRQETQKFLRNWPGKRLDNLVLHHTASLEAALTKQAESKSLSDIKDPISGAIANIIQQMTIGRNYEYQDAEFQTQLSNINSVVKELMTFGVFFVNSFPISRFLLQWLPSSWKAYENSGFKLQQWFRDILNEHKVNRHQDDFMSHMLDLQETRPEEFKDLSIILNCGDMWTGGMETTTTTLRWGLIYLLQNPEIQAKCHQEIVSAFGNDAPETSKMHLTPYVRATLSEIQRLANVLPWAIPHKSFEDCQIGGYKIPANTEIVPALGALLCDPTVFKNPEEFKPERFLDQSGEYSPMEEFRPFGMGPRACLGEKLARTELYLIFSSLVQNFRFYLNESDPKPTTERATGGITAPPMPYSTRVEYIGNRHVYY
ncbi:hypothetical protein B9Z55_017430 [Caenorhabditis nigoni]|uniref:Uncharacterized protein n=3 Tax=Caenorhabditis nigoni TaxID=1611254 RepID=A0A2G5T9X9_9PELO|nr:hypothetical protein B9Z55_017430 [Caenorhabditis nigoni]